MTPLASDRFTIQSGHRISVQIPESDVAAMITAITTIDPLDYGDYDSVTFASRPGTQTFRSLGTGRNTPTDGVAAVASVELTFFTPADPARIVEAIYQAHAYEEPVIFVTPTTRTLHIRGLDEDNPNRFWNRTAQDWLPEEHRGD